MTIVEKAAYLKGLTEGLGVDPESREGKLWGALNDLLADMAHEIEDLQDTQTYQADALDDLGEELSYLEELCCDLDTPEDYDDFDDFEEVDDLGDCDEFEDEEPDFDGVIYDATCPVCGEEISFDEDTLAEGSIRCPNCGELLEFDLGDEDESDDEPKA